MDKLEQAVLKKENSFIATLETLIKEPCSNRIKIAKLYAEYINCVSGINTLVSDAKLSAEPKG